MSTISTNQTTKIFVYGTLKRGFPNHHLLEELTSSNDAVFLGCYKTLNLYPLVCGPLGIPFLINIPGSGHRVIGELYSVSGPGLARLDELEGISRGHYERLPMEVVTDEEGDPRVTGAEGYFGHRSFGEELWNKNGKVGMEEYLDKLGEKYVRVKDRDVGLNLKDYILEYLQSHDHQPSN
ncbi:putative gamma-glutamylcyclotransferase At3g02910 [Chenopodium quinoa]|uniref:Gamma-glutamylcyclotransferase family protein n=1 Tax=Chenopodium quinoa TaxID=63459 RepID=A0A803LU13_CHEQI|nr:putative gamma-glutamylcyclotransferase At3g02910 [Chenopodium quinoa]